MESITNNEIKIMKVLFKDIYTDYNANSLSKKVKLSSMGTLKILKKLEKQNLITGKQFGKAIFYKPNLNNQYTKTFIELTLQKEAQESNPTIKKWIKELRKFEKSSEIGIIFGSVLRKSEFKDIDFLLSLNHSKNKKVNIIKNQLNKINIQKIHLIKQTNEDLKENIKKKDRIIMNALNEGTIIFGYKKIIEIIQDASQQKQS
jgi:predicted nucleotidyltransferase